MLFATGLLTLLALSQAGGDHVKGGSHVKGIDHVKGGSHLKTVDHVKGGSDAVQQAVAQEEIVPAPYSFNIKTGASYGTKIVREETGDSDGRVKGSYSVSSPRGTQRVVEYQADDTGFHANIKTSEPNIKTHSPAHVVIEAVGRKGSGSSTQPIIKGSTELRGKLHAEGMHHAEAAPVSQKTVVVPEPDTLATKGGIKTVSPSGRKTVLTAVSDPQFREPAALPVVTEQIREPIAKPVSVKTTPVVAKGGGPRRIKTIRRKTVKTIVPTEQHQEKVDSEISQLSLPDTKRVAPAPRPVTKTLPVDQQEIVFKNQISISPGASGDGRAELSEKSIIVPGGPLGASFSLSEDEIEKILSSGGVVEFPLGSIPETGSDSSELSGQRKPETGGSVSYRSNLQPLSQITRQRTPATRVSAAVNENQSILRSQTSSFRGASETPVSGAAGSSVVVPGGPGGQSFSLTESEIQRILSSGGVIEFPTDTAAGSFGSRQRQPVASGVSGGTAGISDNVQSISQITRSRKPITRTSSAIDQKQTAFKSQTSSAEASRGQVLGASGQSVVVPGGPGGPTFSLTESEIQSILSSGGVLEFPADIAARTTGTISGQRQPVAGRAPSRGVDVRANVQSVSQTIRSRKPISRISSAIDQKQTTFKSQSSSTRNRGAQVSGLADQSAVVPGGPGGPSFSLTESEIQRILSSGGMLEFPADIATGSVGTSTEQRQPVAGRSPSGAVGVRSNEQSVSQVTRPRKPISRISSAVDQKQTTFKSQTSTSSSGYKRTGVSGTAGQSVVVPGGPGGASFSLTESEIKKILSSGGVIEFPSDTTGSIRDIDASVRQRQPIASVVSGGAAFTRTNIQSTSQSTSPRSPATRTSSTSGQRQTSFRTQTSTLPGNRLSSVSGTDGRSVVIPGGPGGASFSLTESEIQKILSSGGVVEFPSDGVTGQAGAINNFGGQNQFITGEHVSTRSNTESLTQTEKPKKPAKISAIADKTTFKSFTLPGTSQPGVSEVSGQSIVVPGGPEGASFSLTESEIKKILSSGGVIEFPSDSLSGSIDVTNTLIRQRQPVTGGVPFGSTITRSNVQTLSERKPVKPASRTSLSTDKKLSEFQKRISTSTVTSGQSVVVPGGPGGASFSLTESEIKKILSSGGVIEFPSDSITGSIGDINASIRQRQSTANVVSGGAVSTRSNAQSVAQATSPRKPATRISSAAGQRQTTFRTQTSTSSGIKKDSILGTADKSVIVPGGPGGTSFSLTESEIHKILSSGGVVEFPVDKLPGSVTTATNNLVGLRQQTGGRTSGVSVSSRTNIQPASQSTSPRKPETRTSSTVSQRQTTYRSQSSPDIRGVDVSGVPDKAVVVPGGPGGESFTLTDSEIQKILFSGGIVEFPAEKLPGSVSSTSTSFDHQRPSTVRVPAVSTSSRTNLQSVSTNQRKPDTRISSSIGQRRNTLFSGSSGSNNAAFTSSSGPIVVPGASGAPSLTLTEAEIENILSTGGVVEIPLDSDSAQRYSIPSAQPSDSRLGFQVSARSPIRGGSSDVPFNLEADNINSAAGISQQRFNTQSKLSHPSQGGSPSVIQEKVKTVFSDGSTFEQQRVAQVQEPISQIEQFKQIPFDDSSSIVQTQVSEGSEKQLKMKIDDVVQQSSLPSQTVLSQVSDSTPLQRKLSLESFSNKYLQEKVPIEIPGYVPHPSYMAPFNYRPPLLKGMQAPAPIVQEQQKLEQILV